MEFDLNDPATWPDGDELTKLATELSSDSDDNAELSEESEEEPTEEAKEGAKEEAKEEKEPEAASVLAADGKHTLPYSVLKDTRAQLKDTQARLAQLEQELASRAAQPAVAATPAASAQPEALPEAVVKRLEAIKENWGEDIAEQFRMTWELQQKTQEQERIIRDLDAKLSSQEQVRRQSEEEQIADAIAASPTLDAWAKAQDQSQFDQAVKLHSLLMETDAGYKRKDWFDRFKELPERVTRLYGGEAPAPARAPVPASDGKKAKEKVAAAMAAAPTSLSELAGGAPPDRLEVDKIKELKGNDIQAHFNKLAADPKRLEAYLRSFG